MKTSTLVLLLMLSGCTCKDTSPSRPLATVQGAKVCIGGQCCLLDSPLLTPEQQVAGLMGHTPICENVDRQRVQRWTAPQVWDGFGNEIPQQQLTPTQQCPSLKIIHEDGSVTVLPCRGYVEGS